ncbi:spore germination protein [Melghirimyces algeriensis]|uniref:Spore germination protein KA n=1 Tax=Melghirimyces algeriensis TaxID=910412 RepID=A0A521DKF4_9BACL|nr:spore germination protein [Melghirimyces algeriensis]SMO72176.1 spore germination protein KA [Melghirimyces algeriensis]
MPQWKRWSRNKGRQKPMSQEKPDTVWLKSDLTENLLHIKQSFGNSSDLNIREIFLDRDEKICMAVLYMEGLADENQVQHFVIKPLIHDENNYMDGYDSFLEYIKMRVIAGGSVQDLHDYHSVYTSLLSGRTVILSEGIPRGIAVSSQGLESRNVSEPITETVIRGPHEAFCESLRKNIALLRWRIKSPNLWLETRKIGRVTGTNVAIMYINGIVNEKVLKELHSRLDRIDLDGVLESGYIEQLIQDEKYSPFPTIDNTERPDIATAALLEGRVILLVDGTPFVLILPVVFPQLLQSPEDYYNKTDYGFVRILRYISLFVSLLAPSLYVAVTTFHQEMLHTTLLISLAAQREGIPFPAFVEAVLMEFIFETLREAGLRMLRPVGTAITIVGALVLGEAAVQAGLVSPAMVIVVSITAISSFAIPSYELRLPIRALRFLFMALAASFGLYGIVLGGITLLLHLTSLRSFGIPYMSPLAPFNIEGQKDTLFRFPLWLMKTRPRLISQYNRVRQQSTGPRKPDSRP